jgi:adenine-specific DNA-methyltransferase
MAVLLDIKPIKNERPSRFADRLGQVYAKSVTAQHKKDKGQFFTPTEIAYFMASLANQTKNNLKILDPGCGTAILSCSLIEALAKGNSNLKEIELVIYETDPDILPYTNAAIEYLKDWLKQYDIKLKSQLDTNDFVLDNKDCFEKSANLFFEPLNATFDIVISNPPYFKIPKEDKRAMAAKSIIWGQPNIYSIFMMVATNLLKQGGELIFITPRSFASGNYFRAFREVFRKVTGMSPLEYKNRYNKEAGVLMNSFIKPGSQKSKHNF